MNEKEILKKVKIGAMTRQQAAAELGITERTLYRRRQKHGITRPPGVRRAASMARKEVAERRMLAARKVIDGGLTFEEALAVVGVHRTTLQRIINKVKASAQ